MSNRRREEEEKNDLLYETPLEHDFRTRTYNHFGDNIAYEDIGALDNKELETRLNAIREVHLEKKREFLLETNAERGYEKAPTAVMVTLVISGISILLYLLLIILDVAILDVMIPKPVWYGSLSAMNLYHMIWYTWIYCLYPRGKIHSYYRYSYLLYVFLSTGYVFWLDVILLIYGISPEISKERFSNFNVLGTSGLPVAFIVFIGAMHYISRAQTDLPGLYQKYDRLRKGPKKK